jgi:hypothetical protein
MRTWILGAVLAVAACSGGKDEEESDTTDTTDTTMDTDSGMMMDDTDMPGSVDTYVDGITKMSAGGNYEVALTFTSPPAEGLVDVMIYVSSMGAAVTGATVDFVPTMPAMGHGTDPVFVTEFGGGSYSGTGVNFLMGGVWQIDVVVTSGGTTDTATFVFDL